MKPTARPTCPIARVAMLFSDTWTMVILRDLMRKPMHFNELCKSLETISTRTLTLKLKRLETLGIIKKTRNCYAMTATGMKIRPIMNEMTKYGKKYL
jgi:DNA-binding HxlR family transcriptional regulator